MHKTHTCGKTHLKNDATLILEPIEAIDNSPRENPSNVTSKQGKIERFTCTETSR